jgi:hypothetical protein
MRHDRANTVDAFPGIFGFAVPDAPVQPLDFRDDHRLCRHSRRMISRQRAGDLLEVLKPHTDVEPVKNWQFSDVGVGETAPETRTTRGERGHRRVLGAPNRVEFAADQPFDRCIGLRDGPGCLLRKLDIRNPSSALQCHSPAGGCPMTSPLDENVGDKIFENYVELGGKIARDRFDTLLAVFFDLTRAACTGHEKVAYPIEIEAAWRNVSPRVVAFELWERFMENIDHKRDDATRVFQAVNAYAPYSSDVAT